MKSKISRVAIPALAVFIPAITFAQRTPTFNFFNSIIDFIQKTLSAAFPIVTALLILTFGYVVFKYLTDKDESQKEVHKSQLIKALVAIFLWFTLFGIIGQLASSLGVGVGDKADGSKTPGVIFN